MTKGLCSPTGCHLFPSDSQKRPHRCRYGPVFRNDHPPAQAPGIDPRPWPDMPPETSSVASSASSSGRTRLSTMAIKAAGRMPEVARTLSVVGQVLQRAGLELQAQAHRQGDGEDHHVAAVPVHVRQHRDTGGHHHAEHHDHAAAQHLDRHRGDHRADLGHQAAEDQEDRADGHHMAAHHAGHGDQADILAERGVGQRAEEAGNRRAETVGDRSRP